MRLMTAAALLALSASSALAQMQVPGLDLTPDKPALTDEEKAKNEKLERQYRAATGQKQDQKVNDPWGNVRAAPAAQPAHSKPSKPPKSAATRPAN